MALMSKGLIEGVTQGLKWKQNTKGTKVLAHASALLMAGLDLPQGIAVRLDEHRANAFIVVIEIDGLSWRLRNRIFNVDDDILWLRFAAHQNEFPD